MKSDSACAHVLDIELSGPVPELQQLGPTGQSAERALVLVRLYGEPLGVDSLSIPPAGLSSEDITQYLLERWSANICRILGIQDLPRGSSNSILKVARAAGGTAFSEAHNDFAARAPKCSVVVCTRDRPNDLLRCLTSLAGQDHPNFAVWVIDNSTGNELTQKVVDSFAAELETHYVVEPRPGLSRARNTALRETLEGDIVAWIDDDEIADPMWLTELTRAFDEHPDVVAASGLVAPAELRTQVQVWFEQFGGHSKGRGFQADIFSPATWHKQHPLYPLPPFGVGANMAFRTLALREIGGFDEALGAGTPAQGSEDTKLFTDLLLAGGTTVYWPSAITRHFHRRDLNGLRRQMRGYGTGLTAFYTAEVFTRPATLMQLIKLAPRALRDLYSSDSHRVASIQDDFPLELLAENRRGMMIGPWLYLRGRMSNWFLKRPR